MALKSSAGKSSKLSRQEKAAQLDALELTGSSSRNLLINSVKHMFEKGTIRTINIAENLIELIQQDKSDEFDEQFANIEKTENYHFFRFDIYFYIVITYVRLLLIYYSICIVERYLHNNTTTVHKECDEIDIKPNKKVRLSHCQDFTLVSVFICHERSDNVYMAILYAYKNGIDHII